MKETLNNPPTDQCPVCEGRGTVRYPGGEGVKGITRCPNCNGRGTINAALPGGQDEGLPKPKTLL